MKPRQRTFQLIEDLAEQASKEKVLPSSLYARGKWWIGALALLLLTPTLIVGLRSDLKDGSQGLASQMFLLGCWVLFLALARVTWRQGFPAQPSLSRSLRVALSTGILLVGGGLVGLFFGNPHNHNLRAGLDLFGLHCSLFESMVVLLPLILFFSYFRRLAPVRPKRVAALGVLSVGLGGLVAIGLECNRDNILHIGLYHLFPMLLMGLAGTGVGKKVLRW